MDFSPDPGQARIGATGYDRSLDTAVGNGSDVGDGRVDTPSVAPRNARLDTLSRQALVAIGLCLLLTDAMLLKVRTSLSPEKQERRQQTWRSYSCNISDSSRPWCCFR